jgi:hypothetical protein
MYYYYVNLESTHSRGEKFNDDPTTCFYISTVLHCSSFRVKIKIQRLSMFASKCAQTFSSSPTYRPTDAASVLGSDPLARALCEPANCNTVSRIQQEGKEKAGKHFHVFCCLSLSLSSIYLFLYRLRSRVKRFPLHPPPLYLSPSSCHFPSASLLALAYVSFPLQRSRNASLTTLLHSSPHPSPPFPPREAKAGSFTELLLGSSASSPPSLSS